MSGQTVRGDTVRPPPRPDTTTVVPISPRPRSDTTIAVPVPPRPDSIRVDSSKAHPDSAHRIRTDTIKAPLPLSEMPARHDADGRYHWDRRALFATGALTLLDLLERVPGLSGLRVGWLPTPMTATYVGVPGRIRVFYDGLEIDPIDIRMGRLLDLSAIQLWTLQDVTVERGASEIRVHIRSWQVDNTTASTRTDIATGDNETNLYRGFFGRRYAHGEALQAAGQQFSTTDVRAGGSGDALSLLTRIGIGRKRWSADAVLERTHRTRTSIRRLTRSGSIPDLDATEALGYVRAALGSPDSGAWMSVTAGSQRFTKSLKSSTLGATTTTASDSADTTRSVSQYVGAVGFTRWGVRLSATERMRAFMGKRYIAPSARASLTRGLLAVAAFAERDAFDSTARTEVMASLRPLSFIALDAAVADERPTNTRAGSPARDMRGEVGVRVAGMWVSGGVLVRDKRLVRPPSIFDSTFQAITIGRETGTIAALHGRLYKALSLDVTAMRWPTGLYYLPQYQARSQLTAHTSWLGRYPSGHLEILASVVHDYRSGMRFPVQSGTIATSASREVSTLLEIRLLNAVLFWQFRNILQRPYELVPGYVMPRPLNVYGVRWQFFN